MKSGKRFRKILILTAAALMMVLLSACSTFDNFVHTFIKPVSENSENTIYIGVFEPQSGRYAERGKAVLKGVQLANSIYNNVDGYNVKLISVDTQSSTQAGETAIQGLIEMNPTAIIGSSGEANSLIASEYVEKAKIPTITPSATNPLITQNNRYYFRASITESQMGAGAAEYIYKELNSRRIGVVKAKNDTTATALMDGFNDKVKELDGKKSDIVVMNEESTFTDEEIKRLISDFSKNRVDVVFAPLGTETMDKLFTALENYKKTDITFVGTKNWGNPDFISMMSNHPDIKIAFPYDSVFGTSKSGTDSLTEEAQRFSIQYANKYGDDDIPTDYAALGYDSYLLLINAIHEANSLDGADIRAALVRLSGIRGATGVFAFDDKGNTVRSVNISGIVDGKVVSLYMTEGKTEAKDIEQLEKEQVAETEKNGTAEDEQDEKLTDPDEAERDREEIERNNS